LVPVTFAHAEKLTDHFPANSFDLAYASNSLDHSYDPLIAINQMLAVVKPSHHVYLWHLANEGRKACYTGLHQWNFDIRAGELVVDNGRRTQSVVNALNGRAEVTSEFQHAFGTKVVVAKLKKAAPS
jgi:ubiquinone/menaquinone biosynthesis C-methylase UbiE